MTTVTIPCGLALSHSEFDLEFDFSPGTGQTEIKIYIPQKMRDALERAILRTWAECTDQEE